MVHNDLRSVTVDAPRHRVGSPVSSKQLAPGRTRRLLTLFLKVQTQWRYFPIAQHEL